MSNEIKIRWGIFVVVLLVAIIFLFPTLKIVNKKLAGQEITSEEMVKTTGISKPIALGLDLSGGVHLVYEVQSAEAVKSRLQSIATFIRSALRSAKIPVTKAKANDNSEIEIVLLSDRTKAQAEELLMKDFSSLVKISDAPEAERVKLVYAFSPATVEELKKSAVDQGVETLRNRVDQFGVAEPLIQKQGTNRIVLQMPGIQDVEAVKKVVGKVAKLEFRLLPQPGSDIPSISLKDKQGNPVQVEDQVLMTGDAISDARAGFEQNGQIEVSLKLNSEGASTFANLTGSNVGRNLAIILDGVVYSSPVIRERIAGGMCSISGGFDLPEASELGLILRAGALPAPLKVLEERTVGASLGAESIVKGITAILIGFALVLSFMIIYYKKSGFVAVITLALNMLLILACLSAFGATLSLPGLAGLALTIGMAVDSNVIIFERIKEELKSGAGRDASVLAGFEKALSAIIDSNITTLLAGLILFYFGSGPVRGFAVTLCIGILTTIYCATFATRLFFDTFPLKSSKGLSI